MMHFVFCAMQSNIHELPDLVRLAAEIGIEEVKDVYLTVFGDDLMNESLWGHEDLVRKVFEEAIKLGDELGIVLKLPHYVGEDVAGDKLHKDCFVSWRDFSLVRMDISVLVCLHQWNFSNMIRTNHLWTFGMHQNIRIIEEL